MKPCPRCSGYDIRLSRTKTLERFMTFFGFRPHRCIRCHLRFWRFGRPPGEKDAPPQKKS